MTSIFATPFDARTVEPQAAFDPLPAGWYTVMIVDAEEKDASSGQGNKYLELKMEIMGGDYSKRMIWDRLNMIHTNAQTQDIAYRTFSAICHATGQLVVTNPQELYAKPMLVKVKLKAARKEEATGKEYDASNEVNGYKAIDPSAAPVTGPAKPSAAPATAAGPTPAWASAGATTPAASAAPASPPPAWAQAAAPAAPAAAPVVPPAPVAAPVPPPPAATFPPEGWIAHPTAPGYFYKGQEVLTEAALRATLPPPAPVAPPVPPAPVAPPVPPAPAQPTAPPAGSAPPWAGAAAAPAAGTPPWAKAA